MRSHPSLDSKTPLIDSHQINSKILRIFSISFLLIAIFIPGFWGNGNTELTCKRINKNRVNCALIRSFVFGLIQTRKATFKPLKDVKLDAYLIGGHCYGREGDEIKCYPAGDKVRVAETVYGVLLIGDGSVIFDDYTDDRTRHKATFDRIHHFLHNSDESQLRLQSINNPWLPVAVVSLLLTSGFFWMLAKR